MSDIDLFIGDDVREDLLKRLQEKGLPADEMLEPVHYALVPNRRDPEARVDLLFPSSAPETLAIMAAHRRDVMGRSLPVWPLEHIAAAKLMVDPAIDPDRASRDQADLEVLRSRGLLDHRRITEVLEDCREPEARDRLSELLATDRHRRR